MKEKILGILAGICMVLLACSEREDYDGVINNSIMGKDKVTVNLRLSSIPEIQLDGNTDYRPASRAEGNIRSLIANNYRCLVMKEIGAKWYVDTLTNRALTEGSKWLNVKVTDDTKFKDLQLTLRPGHYRLLVVLNPQAGKWNPGLVPGAVVKNEPDTITHAYTYTYIYKENTGDVRFVKDEIFAGTAEFTVEKTSDLHSTSISGDTAITFHRKVMQMRYLLKDHPSEPGGYNFSPTQHTVYATLKATDPDKPFCDGLDCWGRAYYNRIPTTELLMCTDLHENWRIAKTEDQYKMVANNVTRCSPFLFTDELKEVPYQLDNIKITGQSGQGGFVYVYPPFIPELVLTNNSIQPVVFQTTGEANHTIISPEVLVTLEYLKDESSKETFAKYFDPYYECNIP